MTATAYADSIARKAQADGDYGFAPNAAIRRPAATVDQVVDAIRAHRFCYADETQLQEGLAAALAAAGLSSTREVRLNARDRIDILVDDVGIEVKVDGRVSSLLRQITRYAESERVGAIVVVSNRVRHLQLPSEINGKQVRSISLTGAGL